MNEPVEKPGTSALRVATWTLVVTMAVLFVCEAGIMAFLHVLGMGGLRDIVLDPILLSALGAPPLYYILVRPLRTALQRTEQAERSLRAQNRQIITISKALRESQKEAAQHEKMAAVGTIAAGVAHEVGNPLACLSAIVQVLDRDPSCREQGAHLASLENHIGRITKIIRELVDFANPSSDEPVVTDLDGLIEQTVRMVRYGGRCRGAQIDSVNNSDLPRIRIPPQQVQRVLVNLLLNALDAVTDADGDSVITVERIVEGNWIRVTVTDQGVGMTEQEVRQACEPFYTTKPPGEGTGMGLAVSYRIIERLGGQINIESSPERGTVATLSLPLTEV